MRKQFFSILLGLMLIFFSLSFYHQIRFDNNSSLVNQNVTQNVDDAGLLFPIEEDQYDFRGYFDGSYATPDDVNIIQTTKYLSSINEYVSYLSWNLSSIRTHPNLLITGAYLELSYYGNDYWDTEDTIDIKLKNLDTKLCTPNSSISVTDLTSIYFSEANASLFGRNILYSDLSLEILELIRNWYNYGTDEWITLELSPSDTNSVSPNYEVIKWRDSSFSSDTNTNPKIEIIFEDLNSPDDSNEHYLRMNDTTDDNLCYYLNNSVDRETGITIESRARLFSDISGIHGPLGFYIADGVNWFIVSVGWHFVQVEYNDLSYWTWTNGGTFNASQWHIYRLITQEGQLYVYVDNTSIGGPWTTQRQADPAHHFNEIRFGVLWSVTYKAIIDWDYFYIALDEVSFPLSTPSWDIALNMDEYPENLGWNLITGSTNTAYLMSSLRIIPSQEIPDSYLRMYDYTDYNMNYYKNNTVNRTTGVTIEIRARLFSDISGIHGPLGFYIADGVNWFIVSVGWHFVQVEYNDLSYWTWTNEGTFNASQWHIYRITVKEGNINVYVDDIAIGNHWTTQRQADPAHHFNEIRFGILWSRTYKAVIDWDYIYIAQNESIAPPVIPRWLIRFEMDKSPTKDGWDKLTGFGNLISLPPGVDDTQNPELITSPESSSIIGNETIKLSWEAWDEHPAGYICYLNGYSIASEVWDGELVEVILDFSLYTSMPPEHYNITILFYDEFGNWVSDSTYFTSETSTNITIGDSIYVSILILSLVVCIRKNKRN